MLEPHLILSMLDDPPAPREASTPQLPQPPSLQPRHHLLGQRLDVQRLQLGEGAGHVLHGTWHGTCVKVDMHAGEPVWGPVNPAS